MEKATPSLFQESADAVKRRYAPVIQNIFLDAGALARVLEEKPCKLARQDKSLFLLVPRHESFYDLLYLSAGPVELAADLHRFLLSSPGLPNLRASVIGKEGQVEPVVEAFARHGFFLGRKIARMRNFVDIHKVEEQIVSLCEEEKCEIGYALPGEEQAVLNLLLEEFDPRSDNLPELGEIAENIRKKQVIVIRDEGKIIALHYYTIQNSMSYGWYDVITRAFRNKHLYLHMMRFQYELWKNRERPVRSYSWRDVNNKRLMALARRSNQLPDGVYIYNMLLDTAAE